MACSQLAIFTCSPPLAEHDLPCYLGPNEWWSKFHH
jgi:hypothetical protein